MIVKDASMLSKRSSIPKVDYLADLMKFDFSKFDLVIVADEEEKALHIKTLKINKDSKIAIIIGPEGGLDLRERAFFKAINAKIVTFGANILASEIASIYLLSVLSVLT
jgi:16S rRNA (uracil1498-N3)-methyltransferase